VPDLALNENLAQIEHERLATMPAAQADANRSSAHGGIVCQESVMGCPVTCWVWPGLVEECLLAFLAAALFVPPRGPGSSWSARSCSAR
jgi:hypothetical protein